MSVFTTVSPEQASAWLRNYSIGSLVELEGILSGIENTNYFLTTSHGRYVLTLFEKLTPKELPFYLNLMAHLSNHGVPAPRPIANLQNEFLGELNGKPAAVVTRLPGKPVMDPTPDHCALVGEQLADMHLSGQTFKQHLDNLRGASWWTAVAPEIYPFLNDGDTQLLQSEITFQADISREGLPQGPELLGAAAVPGKAHRPAEDHQPSVKNFLLVVRKEDGDRSAPMSVSPPLFIEGIARHYFNDHMYVIGHDHLGCHQIPFSVEI